MARAFAAGFSPGQANYFSHTLADGSVALVELRSVVNGELAAMPEVERQTLRRLLLRNMAAADATAYDQALRERADIKLIRREQESI